MSKHKATAIGHFTKLTQRRTTVTQTQVEDNDADPTGSSSQTPPTVQTLILNTQNNLDSAPADNPGQSPRAEPTVPITFAKRMQDMLSTLPSLVPSTSSGSPPSTPPASKTETEDAPSPARDSHPLFSFTMPSFDNGLFDHTWKSFWSALDRLRLPHSNPPSSPDQPSRDEILDCIDDNNSVMMYGPLEPDETSEVEIACSEIVSINGDGEEIRTPQPSYTPLPSESVDGSLVGRGLRSPPPRFVSLPMDSVEETLVARGLRSPSPRFSPLPLESVDEAWAAYGLYSPSPRFAPLPLQSVEETLVTRGLCSPSPHFTPLPLAVDEAPMARGLHSPSPCFVPLPLGSIDQVLMGGSRDVSSVRWQENERDNAPETTGAAQVPPAAEHAVDKPPVKEYRVWLPSPTKISVQTMWWGFRM